MKKLLRHYVTFGKRHGRELIHEVVVEDTKEAIEKVIVNDFYIDFNLDNVCDYEDFIEGKSNSFEYDREGDWDDPTGGEVVLLTKEEAVKEAINECSTEIAFLEKLFS